jgi:hypothetical protein
MYSSQTSTTRESRNKHKTPKKTAHTAFRGTRPARCAPRPCPYTRRRIPRAPSQEGGCTSRCSAATSDGATIRTYWSCWKSWHFSRRPWMYSLSHARASSECACAGLSKRERCGGVEWGRGGGRNDERALTSGASTPVMSPSCECRSYFCLTLRGMGCVGLGCQRSDVIIEA